MELLNTPLGLNAFEQHVVENFPDGAVTGMIVGAGVGELARALRKKFNGKTHIHCIEVRPELTNHLVDCDEKSSAPWDLFAYEKFSNYSNGLDFIIFNNIHEYWNKNLETFRKVIHMLKPDGFGWISFYNSASVYELQQHLLPIETGFHILGYPASTWAKMDISSWLYFMKHTSCKVENIWGLLEDNAYQFCQENKKHSIQWPLNSYTVTISDVGEAYILGAPVAAIKFHAPGTYTEDEVAQFVGAPLTLSRLQATLFPFSSIEKNELNLFTAQVECQNYQSGTIEDQQELIKFMLEQIKDISGIHKVLVVGSRWGHDLLALKKLHPNWEITGVAEDKDIVAVGKTLMEENGIVNDVFLPGGILPFENDSFDLIFSLKYFSTIYPPLAQHLCPELLRVARKGIVHFEDSRGANHSMYLKSYDINAIYESLNTKPELLPIDIDGKASGLYILKVKK